MLSQMARFHSFYGSVIFQCVCVCLCVLTRVCVHDVCVSDIFFIHSSVNGHLDCFHILAIVSNVILNIGVQISLQDRNFFPLDIHPEVGFLDHMIVLLLIWGGTSFCFPWWLHQFTFSPTLHKCFLFSTSSTAFVVFCLFHNRYPNRSRVTSCCDLDLPFPDA